jgi:hypothetical protein
MIDGSHKPSDEEIAGFIGGKPGEAWLEIRNFIRDHYDIEPERIFGGAKHGWEIRYRKGGRTFCSITPEKGAVRVLIVLGREEAEKALAIKSELGSRTNEIIDGARQLHDGRWLWLRPSETSDVEDIKKLLQIKRKPKK